MGYLLHSRLWVMIVRRGYLGQSVDAQRLNGIRHLLPYFHSFMRSITARRIQTFNSLTLYVKLSFLIVNSSMKRSFAP